MKLSEQLKQDQESGDFGKSLEGCAERAEALESDEEWSEEKDSAHEIKCSICGNKGNPVKGCADCSRGGIYCFSCWINIHIHKAQA